MSNKYIERDFIGDIKGKKPEVPNDRFNKYLHRDPRNFIEIGEPRALYWYSYREKFNELQNQLHFGERLEKTDLEICFMANNLLIPQSFDLRKKDRNPIQGFIYPGISAHIKFSDNIHETCGAIFDRDAKRQDCMYTTTVSEINMADYHVYYLPLNNLPLHVRLVHEAHLQNPELDQVPIKFRRQITEIFSTNKIRRCTLDSFC